MIASLHLVVPLSDTYIGFVNNLSTGLLCGNLRKIKVQLPLIDETIRTIGKKERDERENLSRFFLFFF